MLRSIGHALRHGATRQRSCLKTSRERSIYQSIVQGYDNLAELIEEREHLSQPQRETEDRFASKGPPPPAG
jgi:hypothetical protein